MRIITTTSELEDFAKALAERPFAAIDTEFIREKTYWPILCLIQAAAEGVEAIIDPLADGIDLKPFLDVLANKNVVKVFHAARQDVEIFYKLTKAVPEPLFDTQVAAMACGYGDQISYEALMRGVLNAKIDKGSRFTDWARRPLSDRQLSYALSDVTHLRDAYPVLLEQLERQSRLSWVEEEMAALLAPSLYFIEPSRAWKRLKTNTLKPKEIGPFIKLAEWREAQAQSRDVPRNRIVKDDALMELARAQPASSKDLGRTRSLPTGFERSSAARGILDAIEAGQTMAREDLPTLSKPERKKPPAAIVDLLKVLLKHQCDVYDVAPKLIASASDIEEIAREDEADVPAMGGWRREVFGEAALKLKRGEIALQLDKGALRLADINKF